MNLKYAKKGKGMSEAKWVWTKVAYLWVNGANYKLKFDRITRITEVFRGFFFFLVSCGLICLGFYRGV